MSKAKKVITPVEEPKIEVEVVKKVRLNGPLAKVYKKFLSGLSSTEVEVFSQNPMKAMYAFKKYLADMPVEEMTNLILKK